VTEWIELHRTRHFEGAYRWLRMHEGLPTTKGDWASEGWPWDVYELKEPVESEDGSLYEYQVEADVNERGESVRIIRYRRVVQAESGE
jgi:hypothetical protein